MAVVPEDGPVLGVEVGAGRVDGLGVQPPGGSVRCRLGVFQCLVGRCGHGGPGVGLHPVEFLRGRGSGLNQEAARLADGVAAVLRGPFRRAPVRGLVVRAGVGVRADGVRVQKRWPSLLAAPLNHLSRGTVAVDKIGAVTLHDLQTGKAGEQA